MFTFDNSYARDLTGAFVAQAPAVPPEPRTVILNERLAAEMGLDAADLTAAALSGAAMPAGAQPIAQAYAGHQFGGFSPSLGDGRAVLLGEHLSPDGRRWDIHLKGSGPTPFSRGGDGYAALGPMLREYLMGEAMHALGVPTTQALAVVATGAPVFRETPLPGAVLVRVAASHLRVGTFQFFAARGDTAMLKRLVAYAIARHYPDLAGAENPALALWDAVAARQIDLIAEWMGLGFIHGVMNTDNMTISGETIDYGPCAFMDAYAPGTVFSSIDRQGRYAFANQPLILGWNLARLAEALVPVIGEDGERTVEMLNERLQGIAGRYRQAWVGVMNRKLAVKDDGTLADGLLAAMEGQGADWTLAFRRLADAVTDDATLAPLFADPGALRDWLPGWRAKLRPGAEGLLRQANPAVIPRNHLVEEALAAATGGDMAPFHALADALSRPFDPAPERFALPPPAGLAPHVTFCGT